MITTFDQQYQALHHAAVWCDRTHEEARLEVRGPDATEWLQGLLTQDVKPLQPGRGAHATYLTPQGRLVADLRVLRRDGTFLLDTPAVSRAALLSRLDQFVIMEDVTVTDVSDALGCLTVLGPRAAAAVSACTGRSTGELEALPVFGHLPLDMGGLVARTDAFGVDGFDMMAPVDSLGVWRTLLSARMDTIGADVLETARIEAGRPRFGVDMHDDTIPLEAGLETRAISFDKGCYVGQEVVIRILHRGQGRVARRLVWVVSAPAPRTATGWQSGDAVHLGDKVVGNASSVCWSPARNGWLAIAMLHRDATEPGTAVRIGAHEAVVERLP
jgi:folate-binding protein YgfZ